MRTIWAEKALLHDGWASGAAVDVDAEGRIGAIRAGQPPSGHRVGLLLPAPANCHSHAFQRAMAGLTEARGDDAADSFWTWRRLMYRFLERITPEQVQAIAAFVQMEMLEAGFGASVEFHYLHHQPGGVPYANPAEMSARIAAAAADSGIGLTLLPVAYQYGGCDRRPLSGGQLRFGNAPDAFAALLDRAGDAVRSLPSDTVLGVAPHSLRAVPPEFFAELSRLRPRAPVHMHLAETLAEVAEVQAAYGARPVEWALQNLDLDARWCLIHLTQMRPGETKALARRGVVAGLCPTTEASLGDGIFDGPRWLAAQGSLAVGSDSNIRISLAEELRQLETSQRLRDHARAVLAAEDKSTGRRIFEAAAYGGARAAGRGNGGLEVGEWADLLSLDMDHADLAGLSGDRVIDSFVFAGSSAMVADVWSAGRHVVSAGMHRQRRAIAKAYRSAVADLRAGA